VDGELPEGDFAKAFEVYADVVNNPSFPDDELATMKQRVLPQIASQDATGRRRRFVSSSRSTSADELAVPVHALGQEPNVKQLGRGSASRLVRKKVRPASASVAIYGDVDPAKAEEWSASTWPRPQRRRRREPRREMMKRTSIVLHRRGGEGGAPASVDVKRVELQKTEQALAGVVIGYDARSYVRPRPTSPRRRRHDDQRLRLPDRLSARDPPRPRAGLRRARR
jgi:hypothetical protein